VIPGVAGIRGEDYSEPAALDAGFRTAMLISAGLLVVGAAVSLALLRRPAEKPSPQRLSIEECAHCGVTGPQLHPREPAPEQ
jgi:hypothetical protein